MITTLNLSKPQNSYEVLNTMYATSLNITHIKRGCAPSFLLTFVE